MAPPTSCRPGASPRRTSRAGPMTNACIAADPIPSISRSIGESHDYDYLNEEILLGHGSARRRAAPSQRHAIPRARPAGFTRPSRRTRSKRSASLSTTEPPSSDPSRSAPTACSATRNVTKKSARLPTASGGIAMVSTSRPTPTAAVAWFGTFRSRKFSRTWTSPPTSPSAASTTADARSTTSTVPPAPRKSTSSPTPPNSTSRSRRSSASATVICLRFGIPKMAAHRPVCDTRLRKTTRAFRSNSRRRRVCLSSSNARRMAPPRNTSPASSGPPRHPEAL